MDNFVFSEALEVSIIEHRLMLLFEMLEKADIEFFFPSILFNENFWQAPYEKKLAIISSRQHEWIGSQPVQRSYLYKDNLFLDIIKSIKLTYFSYTQLDLKSILDLFKVKNKFTVSDFAAFGDSENSPIKKLNEIAHRLKEEKERNYELLAKISAVKFYTRFLHNKSITGLVISPSNNLSYWESFFRSIESIEKKQETDLLERLEFYFTEDSEDKVNKLKEEIQEYKVLHGLFTEEKIQIVELNIVDFELHKEFDYINVTRRLETVPTDILIKYNNEIFSTLGRICYTKRKDEKEAIKKVAELESPVTHPLDLTLVELKENVDFEIIFQEYDNEKVVDLISDTYGFLERTYVRFSVLVLTFFVKTIKSLTSNGYMEVWDYNEDDYSKRLLGLFRKDNGSAFTTVNYDLYTSVLKSFSDISADFIVKSYNQVLSEELLDNKGRLISLHKFLIFLSEYKEAWNKFVSPENFIHNAELKKVVKSVKTFATLKNKRILLLGLPTAMYKAGFDKFRQKVLKNDALKKYINKDALGNTNAGSYEAEFMNAFIYNVLEKAPQKEIFLTNEKNSPQNKEFYEFIDKVGLDREKMMKIVNEYWEVLMMYAEQGSNYAMLEIKGKILSTNL